MPEIPAPIYSFITAAAMLILGYVFRRPLFSALVKEKQAQATSAESDAELSKANKAETLGERVERLVKAKADEVFEKQTLKTENGNLKERLKFEKEERDDLNDAMKKLIKEQGGHEREMKIMREAESRCRGELSALQQTVGILMGKVEAMEGRQ